MRRFFKLPIRRPAARPARFRYPWLADFAFVGMIFFGVWGYYVSGANPFAKDWTQSTFYERYYGVVVSSICKGVWQTPRSGQSEVLDLFLAQKRDGIECEELPEELAYQRHLNYQAVNYYYLFKTVEMAWRALGKISWSALDPLLGLFGAVVSVCVYLIFRLGMGRFLSVAAVLLYLPAHLRWTGSLRDYSKAPFFLLVFWLLGTLVQRRHLSTRRLLLTAVAAGLVVGLGMGFRQDVMIAVPAVALTIGAFLPWSWRSRWRERGLALFLFALALVLARAPAMSFEKRVFTNTHVTLLGFHEQFSDRLDLRSSLYEWVQIYSDPWIVYQFKSYYRYEMGHDGVLPIYGEEYSRVGGLLLADIVRRQPADVLIRAYAAVAEILFVPWLFLGLLAVAAARAPRQVLFTTLMILYFTGYTGIQFHPRHFFHVEWVPLWLTFFALHGGLVGVFGWWRWWRERRRCEEGEGAAAWRWPERRLLGRAAIFAVAVLAALAIPLLVSRAYQSRAVEPWLETYEEAAVVPLETSSEKLGRGGVLRLVPEPFLERLPTVDAYHYEVGYLALDLEPARCGVAAMKVTVRYEPGAYHDFSRVLEVKRGRKARFFVPIYSRVRVSYGDSIFLGLETAVETADCLAVARVGDLATLPPIVTVELPARWRNRPLYERYGGTPGLRGYRGWLKKQMRYIEKM